MIINHGKRGVTMLFQFLKGNNFTKGKELCELQQSRKELIKQLEQCRKLGVDESTLMVIFLKDDLKKVESSILQVSSLSLLPLLSQQKQLQD